MGRLLATVATLLVLLLGAAFLAPAFTDWNAYRPDIEKAASAVLGRKISIGGDIDIVLLPEPHLHATKVAAEGGATSGAQMTAEAADLSLSLQALFSGRLEASKIKLLRPFVIVDLSKPLQSGPSPRKAAAPAMGAQITSLEIEGGRISVYADAGRPEALILTGVDGTLFAPPPGTAYRFNGRLSRGSRRFDVKFLASPAPDGVKLAGNAIDLASKAVFQADGFLNAGAPVFDGAVSLAVPKAAAFAGLPFAAQGKAKAKIDPVGIALSDVALTLDPENRPQVLMGFANAAFATGAADITLNARSLDADALLAGGERQDLSADAPAPWSKLQAGAERLLWLYPDFSLRMSLSADQVQLRGELIEGFKVEGARAGQEWTFDRAQAFLPGETAIKLQGALTNTGGTSQLSGRASAEGKNLDRLSRWVTPVAVKARAAPARAFSVTGALALSKEAAAFTGVKGVVDGAPFSASLSLDKTSVPRLQLALAGESFDLSSLEVGKSSQNALPAAGLKAAFQPQIAQLAQLLGDDSLDFEAADIAVSAGTIKTSVLEAKNVEVQLKFDGDLLTVTKLSAEAAAGLALRGEGVIPLKGTGQGRFEGQLEAPSSQAILKALALAGYDAGSLGGARAEDFAPAAIAIKYSADAGTGNATAQLSGTLGATHAEGQVQFKGSLAEWAAGQFSGQFRVSAADGNKLAALLSQNGGSALAAPPGPGEITLRVSGTSARFDVSAAVKVPALQAQADGAAELKAGSFAFTGKATASSQAPGQFLPPLLLALCGAQPDGTLRIETTLAYGPGRADFSKLKAESPKNLVTGSLAIAWPEHSTRLDADLKADQLSLLSLLDPLLTQRVPGAAALLTATSAGPGSSGLWSSRPFALSAFQNAAAKLTLAAKTMKLGDGLAVQDARVQGQLENGLLDISRIEGKVLGGDLSASLSLDSRGAAVAAVANVSLSKADLAALPASGTPALLAGKASLSLWASGQGLSPRGLLSVLQGRGVIAVSDGQLAKFSPAGVQKSADELLAVKLPLTEDTIKKKVFEASQYGDFKFRHLKIPVTIRDGMVEIPRASFRSKNGTVRLEAYLDLTAMQADTTWQAGVSSDRRAKWPPVKIQMSGPLRELGAKPRTLLAEDFVRAVLIRKMEGDMTRLESLDKPPAPATSWKPAQEPLQKQEPLQRPARLKRDQETSQAAKAGSAIMEPGDFEKRMRDALSKAAARPEER